MTEARILRPAIAARPVHRRGHLVSMGSPARLLGANNSLSAASRSREPDARESRIRGETTRRAPNRAWDGRGRLEMGRSCGRASTNYSLAANC